MPGSQLIVIFNKRKKSNLKLILKMMFSSPRDMLHRKAQLFFSISHNRTSNFDYDKSVQLNGRERNVDGGY